MTDHPTRAEWASRLWRDWPQAKRDAVRALSHHLADALEALDADNPCAFCAAMHDQPCPAEATAAAEDVILAARAERAAERTRLNEAPVDDTRHPLQAPS